ncbi:hypothetical protein C8J57DRAFT_1507451 [Mycena rebaudengoi]|nr:hypothetical protein C8J57DRAFT_1507451 [Mycena rebaudengoi]
MTESFSSSSTATTEDPAIDPRTFIDNEASEDEGAGIDGNHTSEEESITSKDLAPSTDDDMPFLLTPIANKLAVPTTLPPPIGMRSNKRKTSPPLNTGSTGSTSAVKRARTVLTDSDSSADAEPSEPNKPESHESTMTALFSPVESAKQINNKLIRPASDRNPSIASTPANNPQPVAMPDLAELIQRNFAAFIPQITDVVISRLQSNLTHGANAVVPTIVAENILPTTPATPIAPPTQTNTPASSQPVVLNTPNTKTVSFHKNVNNKDTNDKDTNKDVAPTHTSMPWIHFGALFSSQADPGSESRAEDNKPDQVFLQDLETYKINFNADAKCEVFDLELQDEVLRPLYIGLPPLPGDRWIVASYDPKDRCSPEAGGRAIFSSWPKQCPNLNGTTVWNIMNFVQSGIYINPCRISPALCSTEKASAAISARRIAFENKTAISVMVGMCTLSYITEAVAGSGAEPRSKRYIHILQHNQEWERWQSFHCLVFGYDLLYSHIDNNAIQLGSILSPMTKVVKVLPTSATSSTPICWVLDPLNSLHRRNHPPKSSYTYKFTPSNGPRYTLAHDEDIPAFDARGIAVDFNNDIGNLANVLPPFKGEIPTGSFVVAGYTASTYLGSVAAREKQHLMNLGCNLVWVVVCGTPIKR